MQLATTRNYDENVERMVTMWRSLEPEKVYTKLLGQFPCSPRTILDVGAGSCRDAHWLACRGHQVTAVEPSDGLREEAREHYSNTDLEIVDDALPGLESLTASGRRFDVILCAAVLMHLNPEEYARTADTFSKLLSGRDDAKVILSFKEAPPEPERAMHVVHPEELVRQFDRVGLDVVFKEQAADVLGRDDVTWHYLVLVPRHDDGRLHD